MNRIRSSNMLGALERMSERERKLLIGGGLLVIVALVALAGLLVSRKVSALEEEVTHHDEALEQIIDKAQDYLASRAEEVAVDELLTRAAEGSLQSTLLEIAKEIQFERKYAEGATSIAKLSEYVKFANASEIFAELTSKTKTARRRPKKTNKAKEKQVFLATIDVVFDQVPDSALFQLMEKIETHPDRLFGISMDMSRQSPNHDQFRAKMKVGQFRYGGAQEAP